MTWAPTTQTRVLAAVERGISARKQIAEAAGVPLDQINTYLNRLDMMRKIRRDGERWVPYRQGTALADAWK